MMIPLKNKKKALTRRFSFKYFIRPMSLVLLIVLSSLAMISSASGIRDDVSMIVTTTSERDTPLMIRKRDHNNNNRRMRFDPVHHSSDVDDRLVEEETTEKKDGMGTNEFANNNKTSTNYDKKSASDSSSSVKDHDNVKTIVLRLLIAFSLIYIFIETGEYVYERCVLNRSNLTQSQLGHSRASSSHVAREDSSELDEGPISKKAGLYGIHLHERELLLQEILKATTFVYNSTISVSEQLEKQKERVAVARKQIDEEAILTDKKKKITNRNISSSFKRSRKNVCKRSLSGESLCPTHISDDDDDGSDELKSSIHSNKSYPYETTTELEEEIEEESSTILSTPIDIENCKQNTEMETLSMSDDRHNCIVENDATIKNSNSILCGKTNEMCENNEVDGHLQETNNLSLLSNANNTASSANNSLTESTTTMVINNNFRQQPIIHHPNIKDCTTNHHQHHNDDDLTTNSCLDDEHHNGLCCCICIGSIKDGDIVMTGTQCDHLFHQQCCLEWIKRNKNDHCPMCRVEFIQPHEMKQAAIIILGDARLSEIHSRQFCFSLLP